MRNQRTTLPTTFPTSPKAHGRSGFGLRLLVLALIGGAVGATTGCTPVAPYERGKLAHPTMTAADLASMGEQHLRAIDEGATGGSAGTGSGCGCN